MAINPIRAVVFDMGGTLEDLYYDETIRGEATRGLCELLHALELDPGLSLPDLQAAVFSGMGAYQAWREQSQVELSPERVWTEYIFADHCLSKDRLVAAADDIALFYETHYYVRSLRPEAPAALEALCKQVPHMAIVSNTLSSRLVPSKLADYGIAHYFDPVVTSAGLGWRKPNTRIFEEAVRLMRLPPQACAYVGDTVSRDVIGARRAGYGLVIQIKSFLTDKADSGTDSVAPDAIIHDLRQIADLVSPHTETVHDH
ncbi:MAG: HAD family hydrolase [Anaerolineales bacterium]|nr:MAG: HAD family hydrolase [Anaerolineales bacterium]